jgi:hypothetical protein
MKSPTVATILRYFDWDALARIKGYGVAWIAIAIFILEGFQPGAFGVAMPLFAGVWASQQLADHWRQRLGCSTGTIVPDFAPTQNRAVLIWHGLLSIVIILLLLYHSIAPVVAIALGLALVWISAWVMLRYPGQWAFARLLWAVIVLAVFIWALKTPDSVANILRQGIVWAPVLLAIGVVFLFAAVVEMRGATGEIRRDILLDVWKRRDLSGQLNGLMRWRLGERLSTLPLAPNKHGLLFFIAFAIIVVVASSLGEYRETSSGGSAYYLAFTFYFGIMVGVSWDILRRFGQARATWPHLWLAPSALDRNGFARRIVTGLLREMLITWLNAAVVFVIAAAILLHRLPAAGYIAILIAMAAVMLGAAALDLLPATWRYRGSALTKGMGRLAAFLVGSAATGITAGYVVIYAAWPLAVFAASAVVAILSSLLLVVAARGLARSDLP